MSIVEKSLEEHVAEALANLLEQFRGKANVEGFLDIYVRQIADAERVAFELAENRWLSTGEGAQLDGMGQIVGEARQGKTDAEYRTALATRINLNLSSGTREDIINMVLGVMGGTTDVEITEYYPAAFVARIINPVPVAYDPTLVGLFTKSAKAAGVNGQVTFHVADPFQFDVGLGWDEGKFGGVI